MNKPPKVPDVPDSNKLFAVTCGVLPPLCVWALTEEMAIDHYRQVMDCPDKQPKAEEVKEPK